ncbi:TPA: hypothetical protein ACPZUW_003777 [Yersinia enterocolitica]
MKIRKSQITYDLDKISARLEEMKNYSQVKTYVTELCEVQNLINQLSEKVNGAGLAFSITGRGVLATPIEKCRFCGEPK